METITSDAFRVIATHGFATHRQQVSNKQNGLFAAIAFKTGQLIVDLSAGTIGPEPTYLTVQVGVGKHITLQPEYLQFINHSCVPNVFFDTARMELVALADINAGDEFCFFYPSTEWVMDQAFQCYCGHSCCIGEIKGAAYLGKEAQDRYRLTTFIREQIAGVLASQKVA